MQQISTWGFERQFHSYRVKKPLLSVEVPELLKHGFKKMLAAVLPHCYKMWWLECSPERLELDMQSQRIQETMMQESVCWLVTTAFTGRKQPQGLLTFPNPAPMIYAKHELDRSP